jgi:hypothetical protein
MQKPSDWTHITIGIDGRAIHGSYSVEDGMLMVKGPGGQRTSQIEQGVNPIWTAVRLLRDLAAAGKA